MKHLFIVIFILLIPCGAYSQEKGADRSDRGGFGISLKNINFIKNNEYFNPVTEGYTLIGYFIQPALIYSPFEKMKIRIGTHILSYAGEDRTERPSFLFSTRYNITEKTSLTMGSLNGSDSHLMFDPHFNKERLYTNYLENGLQCVTETDHVFTDTWLSWENFIHKGDTTREQFTAGESFKYTSGNIADIFYLEVPVQVQFKHFGGQISNYSSHVITYFNTCAGVRINCRIDNGRFGTVGVEYLQFYFKELTGKGDIGITKGYASWYRLHYQYKSIYLGSYYWKSHDYFAPNGNAIYGSVSDYQENVIINDRTIWTNSLYLTLHPADFLEFYIGFDSYYDPGIKRMDTALALHLKFDKLIRIAGSL
jgi:hypothetical protein